MRGCFCGGALGSTALSARSPTLARAVTADGGQGRQAVKKNGTHRTSVVFGAGPPEILLENVAQMPVGALRLSFDNYFVPSHLKFDGIGLFKLVRKEDLEVVLVWDSVHAPEGHVPELQEDACLAVPPSK